MSGSWRAAATSERGIARHARRHLPFPSLAPGRRTSHAGASLALAARARHARSPCAPPLRPPHPVHPVHPLRIRRARHRPGAPPHRPTACGVDLPPAFKGSRRGASRRCGRAVPQWWRAYGDTTLDALMPRLDATSQTLRKSWRCSTTPAPRPAPRAPPTFPPWSPAPAAAAATSRPMWSAARWPARPSRPPAGPQRHLGAGPLATRQQQRRCRAGRRRGQCR